MSAPTTIVTGASSGIGAAVARRTARDRDGTPLVLVGRDADRLFAVAAATGGRAVVADVATRAGRAAVAGAVAGERIGLLVHVAGVGAAGPLTDLHPDGVETLVATNLTAPVELTRALLPALAAAGGHVVLVASIAALGVAGEAAYSATKAGLVAFGDALALEGAVTVTTVLPGAVATPFLERRGYDRAVPRPVPPDRVAAALLAAAARRRRRVFVPGWLGLAARVHGAAPGLYARLAARFG